MSESRMTQTHPPLLAQGAFSGAVYIVVKYTRDANGNIWADEKYEVTAAYLALDRDSAVQHSAVSEREEQSRKERSSHDSRRQT